MFKNLLLIIFIVGILSLFACNESTNNLGQKNDDPNNGGVPINPYDSVGIIHNQALAFTYQVLAEKKINGNLTCEDSVLFYSYNSCLNFLIDSTNFTDGYDSVSNDIFNYIWNNFFRDINILKLAAINN